jgi:hypothetical protein
VRSRSAAGTPAPPRERSSPAIPTPSSLRKRKALRHHPHTHTEQRCEVRPRCHESPQAGAGGLRKNDNVTDEDQRVETTPLPKRDPLRLRVAPTPTARRLLVGVRRNERRGSPGDSDPESHRPLQSVCKAGLLRVSTAASGSWQRRRPVAQRGRTATLHPHLGTTLWIVGPRPVDGWPPARGQLPSNRGTDAGQLASDAGCPRPAGSLPSPSAGSIPRSPHRPTCDDAGHPRCPQDLSLRLEFSLGRTTRERGRWTGTLPGRSSGAPHRRDTRPRKALR